MILYVSGTFGDKVRVWKLDEDVTPIGRSSRNAIHLPDGTVSKDHAQIVRRGERYYIRDLGSRNGTRVNGSTSGESVEIKPGDRIEIGHIPLRISDRDPGQEVRLDDKTVVASSLKIRVDQVLERTNRTTESTGRMVHLLAEAGRLLVLPRPLSETCEQLLVFVEKAVQASRYVILMRDKSGDPVQIAARTRSGKASQPLALSRSIMRTVLDECTSVLTGDAFADPRFRAQQSIVAQSVHSAMAVPLFDNEKVLGLIYADSQDPTVVFGEDQLELLTLLANMAAVKITNALLLEKEQERARMAQDLANANRIQRDLLPEHPPAITGYEVEAFLESCYEVGGDLFDFHRLDDGRIVFVVGDVTGKGMAAALLMTSFLASARVLYDSWTDPGTLSVRLGSIMHRSTDSKRFVTGFVGCLEPSSGRLVYVNAGHPSPMLVSGGTIRELESTGIPFGTLPEFPYTSETVDLPRGSLLALFSDGIPEAQRGDEFFDNENNDRVRELLRRECDEALPTVRERLIEQVDGFLGDAPRTDDITLLLIRRLS